MVKKHSGADRQSPRVLMTLSHFTVPLLSRIYRAFHGDMVAAIVLGEIALRNTEAWLCDHGNPEDVIRDLVRRSEVMRPCNALSIAQACGLPRETVRRKVATLIERGYIYRSDDGHLYISADVRSDFTDMNDTLIDAILTTAQRLESLLEGQATRLGRLQVD